MLKNGTINHWTTSDGTPILYPEATLDVGGKRALRGGAPVCCPIFGTMPSGGPYEGITMPKHGLVRHCHGEPYGTGEGESPAITQFGPAEDEQGWLYTDFDFSRPWRHHAMVSINVRSPNSYTNVMHHSIRLRAEEEMPYSIGFHPYFPTAGKRFVIEHAGRELWREDIVPGDARFFCYTPGEPIFVRLAQGRVDIDFTSGYNGFYIWTDRPDLYICVEPVRVHVEHRYLTLEAGGQVNCDCTLTHTHQ